MRWGVALCALLAGMAHGAERTRVTLVVDQKHPVYAELIESVRRHLEPLRDAAPIVSVSDLSQIPAAQISAGLPQPPDLIVTVGTAATTQIARLEPRVPVLSVLVPRAGTLEIQRQAHSTRMANPGRFSAIYLDQPLGRRLDLVKLVMPYARRIAVVLGPGNEDLERQLVTEGERRRLRIEHRRITGPDSLLTTLDEVLPKSDVLLGTVDPVVFNRTTAQNVLMTAYRHRVPLIGVSPAYVKAGALTAVFSTPSQIGRQLAELLAAPRENTDWRLPPPQYPKYFSVAVNPHIAQSLDIVIDDAERLEDKLSVPR